ncbi:MAG: hypothetical protein QM820_39370 [Minicystis sp.]
MVPLLNHCASYLPAVVVTHDAFARRLAAASQMCDANLLTLRDAFGGHAASDRAPCAERPMARRGFMASATFASCRLVP